MIAEYKEKREYPRLASDVPMSYRTIGAGPQEYKGSLMRDISEGGVRISSYEFLPLNSRLTTEIPLISGRRAMTASCRVAWVAKSGSSERYDTGLEFANLVPEDRRHMAKFLFLEVVSG